VTALEACALLVATIRSLAVERAYSLELEQQRDSYRSVAQVALAELAEQTRRVKSQTATIARLSDELRTLRRRMAA
jgi:hypothetical protein